MTEPGYASIREPTGLGLLAEPPPNAGSAPGHAWMVTFADLAALLLSFFVMLFAMTGVSADLWRSTVQSLTLSFKVSLEPDGAVPTAHRNSRLTRLQPQADLSYLGTILEASMRDDPVLAEVRIIRESDALRLVLAQRPLFGDGSVELVQAADRTLAGIARHLRNIGNPLAVTVQADADDTGGNLYESGWELSAARAMAVADALTRAGYDRPIAALGRVHGGGVAAPSANSVDIAILPGTGDRS